MPGVVLLNPALVVLQDSNDVELAAKDGIVIPANTPGLLTLVNDGGTARYLKGDAAGRQVVVGDGTAGTPVGGVLTVQGIGGGTPIPVSGSFSLTGTMKPLYGTAGQVLTITLASLVNAAARASTAVDNTTSRYEDALFFVRSTLAAAGVSSTGYINIYGYATVDAGTTYPENITGVDAGVTLSSPPNLVLLAQITANTNAKVCRAGPFSFCRMYGLDRLPERWGLVFVNQSGATLNATAGNHAITWQGINGQLV